MSNLVKIRFTSDAVYRVHGYVHPDNPRYDRGAEYEMSDDLAQRWLRRGVAEKVNLLKKPVSAKGAKDDNKASAGETEAAPTANSADNSDKPVANKRGSRKGVVGNN